MTVPLVHIVRGHEWVWECHMDGIRDSEFKALTNREIIRAAKVYLADIEALTEDGNWREALTNFGYLSALHLIACGRKVGLSHKIYAILQDAADQFELYRPIYRITPWYRSNEAHLKLFGQPLPRVR